MPPYLFSILIADRPAGAPLSLPPAVERNIASFQAHHPGMAHRLFDDEAIRDFLRHHMEADIVWAYEQLLPYAYRADLARLCLLYEFGGVYADLSVFFHAGWPIRPGKLAVFRDRAVIAPWIVSNTVISAPPRFAALEAAIRMIVSNCQRRYRGASALCPTGPVLFGKAIATCCEPQQVHLGEVVNAAGRDSTEALVFVDATDGAMIAYRTKTRAGMAELGFELGVNNYNDFYNAGLTYAGDFPLQLAPPGCTSTASTPAASTALRCAMRPPPPAPARRRCCCARCHCHSRPAATASRWTSQTLSPAA